MEDSSNWMKNIGMLVKNQSYIVVEEGKLG
jgi:hypothetical protein